MGRAWTQHAAGQQVDGSADGKKQQRKRKTSTSVVFSGLRFGAWTYPPTEAKGEGSKPLTGLCEARVSFTAAGGKVSYEFPFHCPSQPQANRALIEFPLAGINAVEVDEDAGTLTFLLSVPPCTFVGHQGHAEAMPEAGAPVHFDTVQFDFSSGPVKTYRSHTVFFGPLGPRGRSVKVPGRMGGGFAGLAIRKFIAAMSQDEFVADIIEQERQAEPGGNFPTHEVEASMRPAILYYADASKPTKAKRRASAADALDGPPKKKRVYKPRAGAGGKAAAAAAAAAKAADGAAAAEGDGEDDEEMHEGQGLAAARAPQQVLELGLQQPLQHQHQHQQSMNRGLDLGRG